MNLSHDKHLRDPNFDLIQILNRLNPKDIFVIPNLKKLKRIDIHSGCSPFTLDAGKIIKHPFFNNISKKIKKSYHNFGKDYDKTRFYYDKYREKIVYSGFHPITISIS